MRTDVSFESGGVTCRGWFYRGEGPHASAKPAIVMSHGVTAVKEQYLAPYAERFANEGFTVLVFDYRFLGESGGQPRGHIEPRLQHDDIRAALTWICRQPGVDAERIGLWGTSLSGAHALMIAALDPRVKALAVQVPALNIPQALISLVTREIFDGLLKSLVDDYVARANGAGSARIPVTNEQGKPAFLSAPDAHEWFTGSAKVAPNWVNAISLESIARVAEYVPEALIELIAPKPLLMQVARNDSLIPDGFAQRAFERAGEPKRLELYDCGHFDPYSNEKWHAQFLDGQVAWFKAHL